MPRLGCYPKMLSALLFAGMASAATSAWGTEADQELVDAAMTGDVARVKALLEAKANVNARDGGNMLKAPTPLIKASEKGYADVVRVLLNAKADVNAATGSGRTALYF